MSVSGVAIVIVAVPFGGVSYRVRRINIVGKEPSCAGSHTANIDSELSSLRVILMLMSEFVTPVKSPPI